MRPIRHLESIRSTFIRVVCASCREPGPGSEGLIPNHTPEVRLCGIVRAESIPSAKSYPEHS